LRKDVVTDDFDFPDFSGDHTIGMLIGPHSTVNALPLEIGAGDLEEVIARRGHLYVWGWAEYNDVFADTPRHRTEFCNEVVISRDPARVIAVNFAVYKKYNGADEDCVKVPAPVTAEPSAK
jgi:hypothetical protein